MARRDTASQQVLATREAPYSRSVYEDSRMLFFVCTYTRESGFGEIRKEHSEIRKYISNFCHFRQGRVPERLRTMVVNFKRPIIRCKPMSFLGNSSFICEKTIMHLVTKIFSITLCDGDLSGSLPIQIAKKLV